ncbi:hypothetical protein M1M86_02225 [Dehalococcoidales bacterium]|nr:hypothetical protein [Dehalococcoidales bacterium]
MIYWPTTCELQRIMAHLGINEAVKIAQRRSYLGIPPFELVEVMALKLLFWDKS